ncbi:hypothetical protein [Streptococcus pluranimalium]|uniref:hypothetical protein n=1 Tax=Streptococcus pluranimalium TaxID=82348 RepID=UPI003F671AB5
MINKVNKLEKRMLVTVTVNLMHRMESFQRFKLEQQISGDYDAKIAYLVDNFRVHEKTAENLLSGNIVSSNNYFEIFTSFDPDSQDKERTDLEKLAEQITNEIEQGNNKTIEEVNSILINKLEKNDLKELAKNGLSTSLEKSVSSSFEKVKKPSKGTKISDYALVVWNSYFYKFISEKENLFQIISKFDAVSKVFDYLPLVETIFESEDTIAIFSQVAERLPLFRIVQDWEDWDNVENFIRSVQERNGFDNYLN